MHFAFRSNTALFLKLVLFPFHLNFSNNDDTLFQGSIKVKAIFLLQMDVFLVTIIYELVNLNFASGIEDNE